MNDEQNFLRDLQTACLKEVEDHLNGFREVLASLAENPVEKVHEIQKIIHSMKGSLQAVGFVHFGDFVHVLETTLETLTGQIKALNHSLSDSDVQVFEFFISGVLDAMAGYLSDLKQTVTDSESLKMKRYEALEALSFWSPSPEEKITPAASPERPTDAAPEIPAVSESVPMEIPDLPAAAPVAKAPTAETPPQAPAQTPRAAEPALLSGLYLLFQNTSQYFAIAVEHVVEVIRTQPLSAPPHQRENLSGLLNLRGDVLPILNIKEISSLKNEIQPVYVVVSQIRDLRFGFQVEAVHQVVHLDAQNFQEVQGLASLDGASAISHFCQREEKIISILRLNEVVSA